MSRNPAAAQMTQPLQQLQPNAQLVQSLPQPGSQIAQTQLAARQLQPQPNAQLAQSLPQPGSQIAQTQLAARQLQPQPNAQLAQSLPGSQIAQTQLAARQLQPQPNAQLAQSLPQPGSQIAQTQLPAWQLQPVQMQLASLRPGTTVMSRPFIKLDDLREQVQVSAGPQLPQLAASVASEAVRQCAAQVAHPVLAHSATEVLAKSLRDIIGDVEGFAAAAVEAVINDVLAGLKPDSSQRMLDSPDIQAVFCQMIHSTADMNRLELLPSKLHPKLFSEVFAKLQKTAKPGMSPLLSTIEDSLEAYMLESYQSSVATMSHFLIRQAVEGVLKPLLEPAIANLSSHVLGLLQTESLRPDIGDSVRLAAKKASQQAAAHAWQTCRSSAVNVAMVRAPLSLFGSGSSAYGLAASPASPTGPAGTAQAAGLQHQVPQEALAALHPACTPVAAPATIVSTPSSTFSASPTGTAEMSEGRCPSVVSIDLTSETSPVTEQAVKRVVTDSAMEQPSEDYRSNTTIEALSDELLSRILLDVEAQNLVSCARVCRRWRAACRGVWGRAALRYEPRCKQRFTDVLLAASELALLDCERMVAGRSARAAVPYHVRNAMLETKCRVRGLRLPTEEFEHEFVIAVLTKHADTLETLDLTVDSALCELSSPDSPSQLFSVIDSMGSLKRLRLAGTCDVEYSFRARRLGAPPRSLQVLDLRDYHASSAHTMSSLIRAHQDSLQEALLSPYTRDEEVINLSLCPALQRLSLPVDLLNRCRPASLSAVMSLTLTQSGTFPLPEASPAKRRKTFLLPLLQNLTLDGVTKITYIPKPIRSAFDTVRSLRLARCGAGLVSALLDMVREMPLLQRLDVDVDSAAALSTDALLLLPRVASGLKFIGLGLRCRDDVCWRPSAVFVCKSWPQSQTYIDLMCNCPQ